MDVISEQIDKEVIIDDQRQVLAPLLLGSEIGIVSHDLGDGAVVVAAGDPIAQGSSCLSRQRILSRCPRGVPEFASLTCQLARLLDHDLQLGVELELVSHLHEGIQVRSRNGTDAALRATHGITIARRRNEPLAVYAVVSATLLQVIS